VSEQPLLTVGYSVIAERAGGLTLLPRRADTEVLVVVQGEGVAEVPQRADVRVLRLPSTGVARSRNAVLDHAQGRFVLFADDDVTFDEAGVRRLVGELQRDGGLALAMGAAVDERGRLRKRYPRKAIDLHLWNAAKAATYEMVVRREALAAAGVRFDERFGAGAALHLGDEYVLVADALRAGLRCRWFPHVVAQHPSDSSGVRWGTVPDAVARAAVLERVFGRAAPVARVAFLLRSPRRFGSWRSAAAFLGGAARLR